MTLTALQGEYVEFIHRYIFLNDNFPTCATLGGKFGVHPSAAQQNLNLLRKKGFIEKVLGSQSYRRTEKFKDYVKNRKAGNA